MAAQEYYRDDYGSRPHSPPTHAADGTSGNLDRYNASDDEGIPGRVTSPSPHINFDDDKLGASPSPLHQRHDSAFSDAPGYGESYRDTSEEGTNPYGKSHNVANQGSKEALVPGVRGRRTSGYQDLGAHSISCPPALVLTLGVFLEYAERANPIGAPPEPLMRSGKGKFAQLMGGVRQPLQQRIQNKQNGIGRQRRPYVGEQQLAGSGAGGLLT